ncbi:MAG: hypothetical protein EAZ90_12100 [Oscillatoriales cyanobacterium]|nr:MAG: hypothetical protein EAZ90_12100 [Oscillatoriales cyanobacterium]TAG07719.1 MAG: hypothetical protein EAZ45_01280 [Oscillatoriales cyanobacterium]TAG12886.1 MAG: hypothetical protein EAZ39_29830 [Oscillatoriales cyanobacterium]TAG43538.1 MAG: hypothetical protein EAZ33_12390 [Oscillatoriales cyanobacterium]TAG60448.1 MAG: hypothetical protein EAZ28_07275 [Oscillatoriales cyanobacterium]
MHLSFAFNSAVPARLLIEPSERGQHCCKKKCFLQTKMRCSPAINLKSTSQPHQNCAKLSLAQNRHQSKI